jgi:protein TonB
MASWAYVWRGRASQGAGCRSKKVNISAGVMVGMLLQKTHADLSAHCQGRARSGHGGAAGHHLQDGDDRKSARHQRAAMLQQAALDAVKTWRYRPYLLNNEPVEVETTVNVIFTLGG